MKNEQLRVLEKPLRDLAKEFSVMLTATEICDFEELVNAGEFGVAFENLCTQLYEHKVVVSRDQLKRLTAIGEAMGINSRHWKIFESNNA